MNFLMFLKIITIHHPFIPCGESEEPNIIVDFCNKNEDGIRSEMPHVHIPLEPSIYTTDTFKELREAYIKLLNQFVKDVTQLRDEFILSDELIQHEQGVALITTESMIPMTLLNIRARNILQEYEHYRMWRNGFLFDSPLPCYTDDDKGVLKVYSFYSSTLNNVRESVIDFRQMRHKLKTKFKIRIETVKNILQSFENYYDPSFGDKFLKRILNKEIYEYFIDNSKREKVRPVCTSGEKAYKTNNEGKGTSGDRTKCGDVRSQIRKLIAKLRWEMISSKNNIGYGTEFFDTIENAVLDEMAKKNFEKDWNHDLIASILLKRFCYLIMFAFDPKDKEINAAGGNIMLAIGRQRVRYITSRFNDILSMYDEEREYFESYYHDTLGYMDERDKTLKSFRPQSCKNTNK